MKTTFTNETIENLRKDLEEALKVVEIKYGISIIVGRLIYTPNSFKTKLEGIETLNVSNTITNTSNIPESMQKKILMYNSNFEKEFKKMISYGLTKK